MKKNTKGFTLVELLVVVSIFSIISLAFFLKYPQFRSSLSLKRTAQEVALSIRQAQVYSLSVKEAVAGTGVYPGYGIHFDLSNPKSFILFADKNNNGSFDSGEGIRVFYINTADRISDLCVDKNSHPPGTCGLSELDIVYLRPWPTVIIKSGGSEFSDAEIIISAPDGKKRMVMAWSTGLIEVR